ncbi:MAG: hypothetical protein ACRDI0_10480 [Actinomycetota bacterium]
MGAPETAVRGWCEVHTDQPAVELCRSCGRAACLTCAVPFRGRVLCSTCAARELGEPDPPEPRPAPFRRIPPSILVPFAVGVAATVPAWHWFGSRAQVLSAWLWAPDPWALLSSVCLSLGVAVAVMGRLLPPRRVFRFAAVLGTIGGLAALWSVVGAPEYVQHTPAPSVAAAAGLLSAAAAIVGLRRLHTPRGP